MKNILNLVIYLVCIVLIVLACNNYLNKRRMTVKKDEPFRNFTKVKKDVPGNPTISFNYDTVPEVQKKPLEERYLEELYGGANFFPKYTGSSEFPDQKVIYDDEIYSKNVHTERTFNPMDENGLPRSIAEVFNESITDFKKLTPLKNGNEGEFVVQGATNLSAYNPDYISYDDEKPENGGLYGKADRYKGNFSYHGFDPLAEIEAAIF
jgi:hypothetical protein